MRPVFAATPALLLAGAMLAIPASAQTMLMPYENRPIATPAGVPPPREGPEQAMQTARGTLPRGPYLSECKDARMLQGTLTAFCPKGDGTWHTTQMLQADRCAGSVQNAGGDLVCTIPPQVGSTTPPQSYGSSYGGTYAPMTAAPPRYPADAMTPPPAAGVYPPTAPMPGQAYAAPAYNGYTPYAYPAPAYPAPANPYTSPSATRTAQPYGY
jgi:hypothetical protein